MTLLACIMQNLAKSVPLSSSISSSQVQVAASLGRLHTILNIRFNGEDKEKCARINSNLITVSWSDSSKIKLYFCLQFYLNRVYLKKIEGSQVCDTD